MDKYSKSDRISKAIEAIERGDFKYSSHAAAEFKVSRSAVDRRRQGITQHKKSADSYARQCLTDVQEQLLIERINYLSMKNMPPTSRIVRNLAEELRGAPVGKNWVSQFVARHKNQLKSAYIRNIDNLRVASEYEPLFKLFYSHVSQFDLWLIFYYFLL
jgi:hypothetical protein